VTAKRNEGTSKRTWECWNNEYF